jgi:hypothetical protein
VLLAATAWSLCTAAAPALGAATIRPSEADRHVGREVVVEGYVERAMCSSQACVLSFGPAFSGLVVTIPASEAHPLAGGGDEYEGRTVRVRGTVESRQGRPRIEVASFDDVQTIELGVAVRASDGAPGTDSPGDASDGAARTDAPRGASDRGVSGGRSVSVHTAKPAGPSVAEIARALAESEEGAGDTRPPSGGDVDGLAARVSALEERAVESAALPAGLLPLTDGPAALERPDELAALQEQLATLAAHLLELLDGMSLLEARIAALEQGAAAAGSSAPIPRLPSYVIPGARSPTLSRVRRGWSADRVLRTVGEPSQVVSRGEGAAVWHYEGGRSVTVDERGRVTAATGF